MKISIEEIPKSKEEEVVIRCHGMNEEVMALLHKLKTAGEKLMVSRGYVSYAYGRNFLFRLGYGGLCYGTGTDICGGYLRSKED